MRLRNLLLNIRVTTEPEELHGVYFRPEPLEQRTEVRREQDTISQTGTPILRVGPVRRSPGEGTTFKLN